jgi:hypothetical protein
MIEIISLAIILLILFLAIFWLRKVLFIFGFFFKAFMLFILVCIVGSVISGYYIVKDANDFKNNFQNSTNMILLKQANSSETSFIAGSIINAEKKEFKTMNKEQLLEVEKAFDKDKFSSLNKEYYKIFVIELKAFDNISLGEITNSNVNLTKEEIKTVLLSSNAKDELAKIVAKKTSTSKEVVLKQISATNEEIKNYLLSYYISTVFNPKDTSKFILELKNNNIKVYQETALFKIVKLIPVKILDTLVKY